MRQPPMMKWVVWGFAVLFLVYEFFLRVFPSVMVPQLMHAFNVNAGALGNLSAYYFYAYAPLQIPVGLLMDRFGARRLLTFAAFICGLGSFLFALSMHIGIAETGRFLMGIGSALAFVGMIYVCSHWFAGGKLALMIGIGNSIGMLGAAVGEGPLSLLVDRVGWRETLMLFGIIGVLLAITIYLFVRNKPGEEKKKKSQKKDLYELLRNLHLICKNKHTWINSLGALCFYMATGVFAGLWAVPYLTTTFGLSHTLASFSVSMVFIGWIVGGPIFGHFSDRAGVRKPLLLLLTLLGGITISILIYSQNLSPLMIFILMFLLGAFSSGQLLNFSVAIELSALEAKGTAIAFTNFLIAIGTAAFQPVVGIFLDQAWHGTMEANLRVYTPEEYRVALTTFPVMFLLAFILFFFLKEKKRATHVTTI